MEAWELRSRILERGDQKLICHALNQSPTLVSATTRPAKRDGGDGEHPPEARVVDTDRALCFGGRQVVADAIIQWIVEKTGRFELVPRMTSNAGAVAHAAKVMRESGALAMQVADAAADGVFTLEEYRALQVQARNVKEAIAILFGYIEEKITAEETKLRVVR